MASEDVTIIYVHGNGNKAAREPLKREWDEALFGEDAKNRSRMTYWADLFYPTPLQNELSLRAATTARSPRSALESEPPVESREQFVSQTLTELAVETGEIPPLARPLLERLVRRADELADEETSFEVLPLPRPLRVRAFRSFVRLTFRDVHAYFFAGWKQSMQQRLLGELTQVSGRAIVIGHSLGSIIAYDVLHLPEVAQLRVPLFVTVGSPLGITEIQDLIRRPHKVPPTVARWLNAADPRDNVALDPRITPEYEPRERCVDEEVVNDAANHHSIGPYLRAAVVRDAVLGLR